MPPVDPSSWLLHFSSNQPASPLGDGRPWGDGTAMAARALTTPPRPPWDTGCTVTPIIGGYAAMQSMRQSLKAALDQWPAPGGPPEGQRGRVEIADWRLNSLRDISDSGDPWPQPPPSPVYMGDPTVLGWVLRLMQRGIQVRIMVWMPTFTTRFGSGPAHPTDHLWLATIVGLENDRLMRQWGLTQPIGVVALDDRTAGVEWGAGTHHQKMMVIRSGNVNVAFCGGVDLAFTRRDGPNA